jgi:hypothetical protein
VGVYKANLLSPDAGSTRRVFEKRVSSIVPYLTFAGINDDKKRAVLAAAMERLKACAADIEHQRLRKKMLSDTFLGLLASMLTQFHCC